MKRTQETITKMLHSISTTWLNVLKFPKFLYITTPATKSVKMPTCFLNEKIHNKICNALDKSEKKSSPSEPTYYKSIYGPATLMNDWYEKRTNTVQTTSSEPLLSENMDKYRSFCINSMPDRREYFTKVFEGYGLGQELLLDHSGFAYYDNYVTSYDLMFNHLTKGACGPHPRRYYKCQYLPEMDLTKIYGNLTQWGLKEQVYQNQKIGTCKEVPKISETNAQYVQYDIYIVKKLNDFPKFKKLKIIY